jgi:hypothetical protein
VIEATVPDRAVADTGVEVAPQLLERFARHVAGRIDVLRIQQSNGSYTATTWSGTLPDVPYAVHLYDRSQRTSMLALDFDAHDAVSTVGSDVHDLRFLLGEIGLRYVVAASGPSGGVHVYVPLRQSLGVHTVRAIATALAARYDSLDISMLTNASTGAIRPPGSPHRRGGRSTVHDQSAALQVFEDGNDHELVVELVERLGLDERVLRNGNAPLSAELYRMLRTGYGLEGYESFSEATMALAVSVISRGHDPLWLLRQLNDNRNAFAARLHDHLRRDGSRRDAQRLIQNAVSRASVFVSQNPSIRSKSDALDHLDAIEARADSLRWTGRSGLSARAVLTAHLHAARTCGGVEYNLSQRQVCELAALHSRTTVESATRHLVALGFVRLVRNGSGRNATTWRLRLPADDGTGLRRAPSVPGLGERGMGSLPAGPLGHPLFSWRALGKVPARILSVITTDGPSTSTQIAARTGLHPGSVRNGLRLLRNLEQPILAQDRSGSYHLTETADLSAAAAEIGADVSRNEMLVRHDIERALWRGWLVERAKYLASISVPVGSRAGPQAA